MTIAPGNLATAEDVNAELQARLLRAANLADVPNMTAARGNLGLGGMATQNPAAVAITGGTINGVAITGGTINGVAIGGSVPAAALLDTKIALGLYTLPSVTRMWSGGVTSSSAVVNYDVIGTDPATDAATVGLVVSVNANLSSPVFVSANTAPVASLGFSAAYFTGTFTATGLAPDTAYFYSARINGVASGTVGQFRTAPTNGTAKRFNFIVGSCTNGAFQLGDPYAPVAALSPAFAVHCGDMDYSDIILNDPRAPRDRNTRAWRGFRGVAGMTQTVPIVYMPDDHDFGPDDNHWDIATATKVTHAQIGANTRLVVRETTPRYPDWNAGVLSQSWTWGRVRFIMPDLRSQRRYVNGGPTFLGDGADPPTGYDHLAAVLAAIDQAATDGMKMLVFISTSTWTPSILDSWDRFNSAEQETLANKFRNSPVHVMLITGDTHVVVADDGTNTDRSTLKDGKLPFFTSSGWNIGTLSPVSAIFTWNGVDGDAAAGLGNGTAFLNVSIEDDGGDNIAWQADFRGAPLAGPASTLLTSHRSNDVAVAVGFHAASTLTIETLRAATVQVQKNWFGPIPGCTVNYAWASGPSGVLTFDPNRNTADIQRAYTDGAPDTVTLSGPVRCALGVNTARIVNWITLEAETSAWLAEVTVRPNDEQVFALNEFIAGLKTDSVWSQVLKLYWLGAHTQQASLIEFKAPGTGAIVPNGAVNFSAKAGWRGENIGGANKAHLETGYAIPAGNQNSMAAFLRYTTTLSSGNGDFGGEKYLINSNGALLTFDFRTRSSSTTSNNLIQSASQIGSFGMSRTGSANYKKFVNGVAVETVTQVSTAPDATTMWFCGWNSIIPASRQSGGRRVAMGMISAGLTDADVLLYHNRETTFLQAVGIIP